MSIPSQQAAESENTQSRPVDANSAHQANDASRGGPRTDKGRLIASQNAIKTALFTAGDFIRPGEEKEYAEISEELLIELNPHGILEHTLFDEIRRATWRLRRCGKVESNLVVIMDSGLARILDPMEVGDTLAARTQKSVDRARACANRQLKQSMAELRKLQTERWNRLELLPDGADVMELGLVDYPAVVRAAARYRADLLQIRHDTPATVDPTPAAPAKTTATKAPDIQRAA